MFKTTSVPDSAYVTAAKAESRNLDIIHNCLNNSELAPNEQEHCSALRQAIVAGDLEITKLIFSKINFSKLSPILDTAFRYPNLPIILFLLSHKKVIDFLRKLQDKDSVCFMIQTMGRGIHKRAWAEIINQVWTKDCNYSIPVSLNSNKKELALLAQRTKIETDFKKLKSELNSGFPLTFSNGTQKLLPALPEELINTILDLAYDDQDLSSLPISKQLILKL